MLADNQFLKLAHPLTGRFEVYFLSLQSAYSSPDSVGEANMCTGTCVLIWYVYRCVSIMLHSFYEYVYQF